MPIGGPFGRVAQRRGAVLRLRQRDAGARISRVSTLVDVLVAHQVDDAMVAQVCVDLVASWSGGMSSEEMYRDLMAIHLRRFDSGVDAGDLFDGVRNQYGVTL